MDEQFYLEFSDHEYYALVVVTRGLDDLYGQPHVMASRVYADVVAGVDYKEVLEEATPWIRTKEYAFEKFLRSAKHEKMAVSDIISQFDDMKHGVLLIDHSLI